ncbi:transferase family-domain-containing protein [Sordaria brevicollis]|uniref:Transferase family-domain-containing protein n=1 Tax=Sordaria brevicollis TaxID=83679 RepID=A0AAE0PEP7_SORBR|nr:transferase family-domain-containing protein [Sordaria brevicollis]
MTTSGNTSGDTAGDTPINITATHTITFADPKSLDHLPSPFLLGPLDHFQPTAIPTDLVYIYEKPVHVKTEDFIPISRLREAISNLLNYYPHLTGRLAVDPSNGVRSITKLGMGASLLEASCDQPLKPSPGQDIEMGKLPGTGEALIAPWNPSFDDETGIQRGPLLLIQHTQFKCGSVAIGYRISHAVCAAEGCIHLYQDLCEIYRKLSRGDEIGVLDLPPHIIPFGADRIITASPDAEGLDPPVGYLVSSQPGDALGDDADKHMKSTVVTSHIAQDDDAEQSIAGTYLHFSPEELARLKASATSPDDDGSWISTFEALVAYLWQRTHRARVHIASTTSDEAQQRLRTGHHPRGVPLPGTDCLPTPSLWTNVNFALPSRLDLAGQKTGMGKSHYFPNAHLPVFFTLPNAEDDDWSRWAGLLEDGIDLGDAPLWQVARLVHQVVRDPGTSSTQYALGVIYWMCDLADKRLAKVDFNLFADWCFVNTDWSKWELYGVRTALDVEAALAGPPFTKVSRLDGFTTFIKAREGIDVRFTLNEAAMRVWER